jgi:hypothetical protein
MDSLSPISYRGIDEAAKLCGARRRSVTKCDKTVYSQKEPAAGIGGWFF